MKDNLQDRLLYRFLRYAAVTTQSKRESEVIPSTPGTMRSRSTV